MIPMLRFSDFSDEWQNYGFFELLVDILDFRGLTPLKLDITVLSNLLIRIDCGFEPILSFHEPGPWN